jgi:multidrug efflux pump subunit AcrA (membrane-fusion protein)
MRLGVHPARLLPPRLLHSRLAWGIAAGVVVAVLAVVSVLAMSGMHGATPQTVASTVSTVRRGTVAVTASAAGTVQASATRGLSFSVAGTVTELDVRAGDTVSAGQVLARIDSSDQQTAVASAQDALTSAENALATAQQSPSPTPTTGTCVAPAAYVLGFPTKSSSPSPATSPTPSPSPSTSSPAPPAPSPSPSSPSEPATSPSRGTGGGSGGGPGAGGGGTGSGGTGGCRSGSGSGGGTSTGGNGGANRGGSGGDALFSAQQQVNNAQLALTQAQQKLAGTVITAPVAGRVLSVGGTVGSAENPGGTGFIVLGGVSDTEVTAMFTETDVAHLAVGQPATITLPDRTGQPLTGKVSQVSPAGTTSGRLVRYPVMVAFDQVPTDLLYGQSANVVITTQSVSNVLYVSSSAVQPGPDGSATVTVRSNGQDQQRTVQTGLRGDQYTEIRSGLSVGDSVVTGGR